jgi:hypothetical protein
MIPRSVLAALTVFSLALVASMPARAEMYKWVDENGVVNYSNEPPKSVPAQKLTPVPQGRISIYQTREGAPAAARQPSRAAGSASTGASAPPAAALRDRIDSLERQLEQQRQQDAAEAERRRRAYEECVRDHGVDCDRFASTGLSPTVVFAPARRPALIPTVPVHSRETRPPRRGGAAREPAEREAVLDRLRPGR